MVAYVFIAVTRSNNRYYDDDDSDKTWLEIERFKTLEARWPKRWSQWSTGTLIDKNANIGLVCDDECDHL